MLHQVRVPRLNANEDEVLLVDVLVSVGDRIEIGQELFAVESSKAVMSVEAEVPGYVRSVPGETGRMVAVGATLCLITDTQDEPLPDLELVQARPGVGEETQAFEASTKLTAKEQIRLRRQAASRLEHEPRSVRQPPETSPVEVTASGDIPWVYEARATLEELSRGDDEFTIKVYDALPVVGTDDVYRAEDVYVGAGVRFGKGSAIRAKRLYIGPGVQIGDNCYIEADSVYIGAETKIGNQTGIVTGELILREGVVVADQVMVDLAGGRSSDSRLLVGHGSLIAPRVLINTCREVVLENETAVSPGAMVFTHSFWQSVLEGYSVAFHGVRVCEKAWVGAGCQILPGVRIGPGAVVMSNSTVIEDVPPFSLVGGVPARVIRSKIRRELDLGEQIRILHKVLQDFIRHLEFKGCTVDGTPETGVLSITLPDGSNRTLTVLTPDQSPPSTIPPGSIFITLGQSMPVSDQASVFDIVNRRVLYVEDRLTHELRTFLRRHGIRFSPFAWDSSYTKGL
jgi:acetyltransferase-like isoleucine patch superfamily enzyme